MTFNNIINNFLGDRINLLVLQVLYHQKNGVSGRMMSRLANASVFKVHHVLKFLVRQGVVKEEIFGKTHRYQVNRNHILVKELLNPIVHFEQNIFQDLGMKIAHAYDPHPLSVVLYGSVARGEEKPDSDIDIALITHTATTYVKKDGFIADLITLYGNTISIRVIPFDEFRKKRQKKHDPLIRAIIKEGKSIYGKSFIELFGNL